MLRFEKLLKILYHILIQEKARKM